jgi:hypothetical protein
VCSPLQAGQRQPVDYSAFPELSAEHILPPLVASLRDSVADPASITNFRICLPPFRVRMREGRPHTWNLYFYLNARNSYGGYAGVQGWVAVFRPNRPVWTFSNSWPVSQGDLARCLRVPDAEIQRLLAS